MAVSDELALVLLEDGQPVFVLYADEGFEDRHPRDKGTGRFKKKGEGDTAGGLSGELSDVKFLGGGVSGAFKAKLPDGRAVVVKAPPRVAMSARSNIDMSRANAHAVAASEVAKHLGLRTPEVEVRKSQTLGDEFLDAWDDTGKSLPDEFQVQEFVPGMTSLRAENADSPTREEAEKFLLLDYLIGNADRHPGNWCEDATGNLVALDMDMTFPTGDTEANSFDWSDEHGNMLDGQDMLPELHDKLQAIEDEEDAWHDKLEAAGLSLNERWYFFDRLQKILDGLGKLPEQAAWVNAQGEAADSPFMPIVNLYAQRVGGQP